MGCLLARSPNKIYITDFSARSLCKLLRRGLKAQGQATRPSVHRRMQDTTTATSVSWEPVHAKCTWTCHKRHWKRKCAGKMPGATAATNVLCKPAQSKYTWTYHKSHFAWTFTREMPDAPPLVIVLCEPAQSKCTWTFHKSYFLQKFTGEIRKCRMRRVPPRLNTGSELNCKKWELLSVATLFAEKSITHLHEPIFIKSIPNIAKNWISKLSPKFQWETQIKP